MTTKIKIEKDGVLVAEFELVDNEYIDYKVQKEHELFIKALIPQLFQS